MIPSYLSDLGLIYLGDLGRFFGQCHMAEMRMETRDRSLGHHHDSMGFDVNLLEIARYRDTADSLSILFFAAAGSRTLEYFGMTCRCIWCYHKYILQSGPLHYAFDLKIWQCRPWMNNLLVGFHSAFH